MQEPGNEIDYYQPKELSVPFPLIQELFDEGEKTFGGAMNGSSADYYDEESQARKPKLSEKFAPLCLGDDPSKYYFTYYNDRRDNYYAENTRERSACLSTAERKYSSSSRLRELIYSQDESGFYLTVGENVNNRVFLEWRNGNEDDLVKPSGRMQAKYKLSEGKQILVEFTANRVDEVVFDNQPCRWTRSLRIDNGQTRTAVYQELYIVNRSKDPHQEKRANVSFQVNGRIENPRSAVLSIGFGPPSKFRIIAEDKEKNVKVVLFEGYENDLNLLKQDPNFLFLNETDDMGGKMLALVHDRIKLLQQQWDKPQSVFISNPQIESSIK